MVLARARGSAVPSKALITRPLSPPEMVPGAIGHNCVASFHRSANMYNDKFPSTIYEKDTYNMYYDVHGVRLNTSNIRTVLAVLMTYEYYVVLTIDRRYYCTTLIFGWRNKSQEEERATKVVEYRLVLKLRPQRRIRVCLA